MDDKYEAVITSELKDESLLSVEMPFGTALMD